MEELFYQSVIDSSLKNSPIDSNICMQILESSEIDLLSLLNTTFKIREKYWGKKVAIQILNNVENGNCPENCTYCAQSTRSKAKIEKYTLKSEQQIFKEAEEAYKNGAFRHCLVFAGKKPSKKRVNQLVRIVKKLKQTFPMQICVSPGKIDFEDAKMLKEAGLDRINHNLNTSEAFYSNICTSHTYQERFKTIEAAKAASLQICSGLIVGMNETSDDIIDVALKLKTLKVESIPINFFIPIKGLALKPKTVLTPEYCLRVLCLFRILNPKADIRAAAGRELHLRQMQPLALYAANSLFVDGYLNTPGNNINQTLEMIKDAGFETMS